MSFKRNSLDLGRGVTALGIRGDAQATVQRQYAFVQETIVRFSASTRGCKRRAGCYQSEGAGPAQSGIRRG